MGKTSINSRDNHLSLSGILDLHTSWLNQPVNSTASPVFQNLNLNGNAVIGGNLTVNGQTTIVNTDILTIKDNIIEINSLETGIGVTTNLSGLSVNRGSLPDYQIVFRESDDAVCLGEVGNLQVIATREDNPLDKGILVFNNAQKRLNSTTTLNLSTTFNSNEASLSSSTGTLRIVGGVGITGDIYTDSRVYIKGNTYTNFLDSNTSDELILNSGLNILLNATDYVKIPTDVKLSFSSNSNNIASNGTTGLSINSNSSINLNTGSSAAVKILTNAPITFGATTEKIVYDGTNTVLSAANELRLSSSTIRITGTSTTSLVLAGGVSILNTTDATSNSVGGTITTAGGASVAKKLFVGGDTRLSGFLTAIDGASVIKKLSVGSSYTGNPGIGDGITFENSGYSFTDNSTVANGSVNDINFNYFGISSISATNSNISTTNASTVYIEGAPVQGANQTLVNRYALLVDSGISKFGGDTRITSATASNSPTTGALVVDGGVSIKQNLRVNKNLDVSSYVNTPPSTIGVFLSFSGGTINDDTTTTTATEMSANVVSPPTISANNVITTTNASTFTITGAPIQGTNQTLTNKYALWVKAGDVKIAENIKTDGLIDIANTADATSISSGGNLITAGGARIAKKLFIGGQINSVDSTIASSVDTGSITTVGGVGIGKNLFVSQNAVINGTGLDPTFYGLKVGGNTFNDTNSLQNGTLAKSNLVLIKQSAITSLNTGVITTSASSLNIEGPPTGNITNAYSLNVESGKTRLAILEVVSTANIIGDLSTSGNFDVAGIATLKSTTITGNFNVNGTGNVVQNMVGTVSSASTGNTSISSGSAVSINGETAVNIDTNGGISLDAVSNSNMSVSSGSLNLSGNSLTLTSATTSVFVSPIITLTTSTSLNLNSPVINIGDLVSETTVKDNLTVMGDLTILGTTTTINSTLITVSDNAIVVNSMPSGLSDGGLLVKRYQVPNNTGMGQVVLDTPAFSGQFDTGSSGIATLILKSDASSVNNYYKGWWIKITSGTSNGVVRRVKGYVALTKTITIYITSDNSSIFQDGLDLPSNPVLNDTYSLYPGTYSGMFYDDTNEQWAIGKVPFDSGAGSFPLIEYSDLHIKSLIVDGSVSYSGDSFFDGNLTLDNDNAKILLARKNGNAGDVFYVNTITPGITIGNPDNTTSSKVYLNLTGKNSLTNDVVYSKIENEILVNAATSHSGSMNLSVAQSGTLVEYIKLNGNTQSINLLKGVSITNASDATSSTGSITTAGGLSVAKKLFTGDSITVDSTFTTGTSASIATFKNNGNTRISIVDIGSVLPAGIKSTGGMGLYGSDTKIYDTAGTLFCSISSTSLTAETTTSSNSSSTGSIVAKGGVGIAGALYVGGSSNFQTIASGAWNGTTISVPYGGTGATSFTAGRILIGSGTNALTTDTSLSYTSNTLSTSKLSITDIADSTNTTTGSVIVSGGVGIGKNLFVGQNVYTTGNVGINTSVNVNNNLTFSGDAVIGLNTTDTADNGSITICGGGLQADTRGGKITINGNETSDGGSVVIAAGNNNSFGTVQFYTASTKVIDILYNGQTRYNTTTDSISSVSGSVILAGGMGIAKKLFIGGDLAVSGNSSIGTVSSGIWNAATVSVDYGGTGANTFNTNSLVVGNGTSALTSFTSLTYSSNLLSVPKISSTDTTQSTSSITGAITLSGGMGVAKNVHLGENLFVTQKLGVGSSLNVNNTITLVSNGSIGINTVITSDTGSLFLSGSGSTSVSRGGIVSISGIDHATTPGKISISAGNVAGGNVSISTTNTERIRVDGDGKTNFVNLVASTSSTLGSVILSGGLSIANTTNAVSNTNGGGITCAGGVAVSQDVYIGGNLYVGGAISGGASITSPPTTTSSLTNITNITTVILKLIAIESERTYSGVFLVQPSAANTTCSFEFTLPNKTVNWTNTYEIVASTQGYFGTTAIQNIVSFAVVSSTRAKMLFTSANTGEHAIQFVIRYTI